MIRTFITRHSSLVTALEVLFFFAFALLVYGWLNGDKWLQQSLAPHYIHLADSFLAGRLDIADTGNYFDLTTADDQLFVTSPPMPGIVMMPIVAVFTNTFSDTLFSVVWGAVTVAAVHALYRKRWLTVLFAFGTPFLYFSGLGTVWFQAQAVAVLFSILAVAAAQKERPTVAGLLWGMAILSRPTLLFGAPVLLYFLLKKRRDWQAFFLFCIPIGLSLIGLMAYNVGRFGSPFDFGYESMLGADNLVRAIKNYGTFHPRFLACNLYMSLLAPPVVANDGAAVVLQACSYLFDQPELVLPTAAVQPNPVGMSIFLATPAFLLLFLTGRGHDNVIVWAGILAIMLPNWFLHNTGSLQFGYRYWMDAAPFWLLLLSRVIGRKNNPVWLVPLLVIASIALHFWGYDWLYGIFVE